MNMRKKILIPLIWIILYPLSINAQNDHRPINCGTSVEDLHVLFDNMMALRTQHNSILETRGAVSYVPVCFHLVARADGTGRVNEAKLLDMIDQWNKTYSANGLELQFYIKYLNNIQNAALFSTPSSFEGGEIAKAAKKSDALNIFICGSVGDGSTPNSTTLAYYQNRFFTTDAPFSIDWIVIRSDEVSRESSSTIEHEVGHFFSLPHTFNGFECSPFTPTSAKPCAPKSVDCNWRLFAVENAVRTGNDANCSTAGDGFCDTPPDYNFGFTNGTDWNNPNNPCAYNGIAKDPTCIALNPDETNLMGYYTKCSSKFSTGQVSAMKSDYLNSSFRKYLRDGNTAQLTAAVGLASLTTPFNNATTQAFNNITFDWSDLTGAYGYVFEISPFLSFISETRRFVVYSSNITLDSKNTGTGFLVSGKKYFWRVRAFGRYVTGTSFTTANQFTTGRVNSVNEIFGIENFIVSPNPVHVSESIEIRFNSEKPFNAQLKWTDMAGQTVKMDKIAFNLGLNAQLLNISTLQQGMYILSIQSEDGVLNKKVFIEK
jgi:Secretion system C-terminal sorting domain/Pregnancy-associated plasma protein-A